MQWTAPLPDDFAELLEGVREEAAAAAEALALARGEEDDFDDWDEADGPQVFYVRGDGDFVDDESNAGGGDAFAAGDEAYDEFDELDELDEFDDAEAEALAGEDVDSADAAGASTAALPSRAGAGKRTAARGR